MNWQKETGLWVLVKDWNMKANMYKELADEVAKILRETEEHE